MDNRCKSITALRAPAPNYGAVVRNIPEDEGPKYSWYHVYLGSTANLMLSYNERNIYEGILRDHMRGAKFNALPQKLCEMYDFMNVDP